MTQHIFLALLALALTVSQTSLTLAELHQMDATIAGLIVPSGARSKASGTVTGQGNQAA